MKPKRSIWRRSGIAIVLIVTGIALGLGSAWLALRYQYRWATISNGPWRAHLDAGGADAGLYTRAEIAIGALLALNKTETIYYIAEADSDGDTLRSRCDYRIEGSDLAARWWSITLYADDRFLIPNEQNRFSYGATSIAHAVDGTYAVTVSQSPKPGNWLPSGNYDQLFLALRLYNPAQSVYDHPTTIALPRIVKERCS